MQEFHILKSIRQRIQFDDSLFHLDGNIVFANFHAVRKFVQKLNEANKDTGLLPEYRARTSDVNAIGLVDEIFHYIIRLYEKQENPQILENMLSHLVQEFGKNDIDTLLATFVDHFPSMAVYHGEITPQDYLEGSQDGRPNRTAVLEELLIIWLANQNPAYLGYKKLFDDEMVGESTNYEPVIAEIGRYFKDQPGFGPFNHTLVDMLRTPAVAEPRSIFRQLEYIRTNWGYLLGDLLLRILSSLDLLREEEKLSFQGPGPVEIPLYDTSSFELLAGERYSQDQQWMPNLVMIAKNTYVWLHQLSRMYQQPIRTLSEIPDDALINLARWGINGLWLIGIWERSQASARIKQLTGNPEAISSAYALHDYQIADDLGGELAYQNLNERARKFGIRLASDMVPNHTAIDSRWMQQHPDWFISLPYSPFPAYQFSGPDLSNHPDMAIYLDDHYFDRTDAAVVFKRVDRGSGQEIFVYHGNDGTSYPWNDTAQLNFLKPEVREAVIQNILQVAKRFQVIRFDAAMTLTKRHFHRLWFPEPGSGGDIPSRADHAMSSDQFNQAMPREFWREVVERVTAEAPDTLLLAEAFWLMESYFVRTLGMHRVYNSAFMNLLRDEGNAKYRTLMKNTLEFDPEILKRFVNFLNNPDERTAVDQFGKGDKYFGVTILMVTMPGLPMFGHGQIEGYTEKYGMEYRQSYWEEQVDLDLVRRHENEIFPLLRKRYLFAHVQNFLLYDFFVEDGTVNEDVFAYSNRAGSEAALVLYNNRFNDTQGWVRTSVGFTQKTGDNAQITQKSLAEGLNIQNDEHTYTIFKDHITQLEYIRKNTDIIQNGLFFALNAYQAHVLLDFMQIRDHDGSLKNLYDHLDGRGAASIEFARFELELQPVLHPLRQLFTQDRFNAIHAAVSKPDMPQAGEKITAEMRPALHALQQGVSLLIQPGVQDPAWVENVLQEVAVGLSLQDLSSIYPARTIKTIDSIQKRMLAFIKTAEKQSTSVLFAWILLHNLDRLANPVANDGLGRNWFEEWRLDRFLSAFFNDQQSQAAFNVQEAVQWVRVLIEEIPPGGSVNHKTIAGIFQDALENSAVQSLLSVNRFKDATWFSKETFETFLNWLLITRLIQLFSDRNISYAFALEKLLLAHAEVQQLERMAAQAGYQVEKLLPMR